MGICNAHIAFTTLAMSFFSSSSEYELMREQSVPVESAVEPLERWDSYENFNTTVDDTAGDILQS